ncbi:MAG: immunoglobulin-like domain-containing protein [Solirubrobacterales bacterium]
MPFGSHDILLNVVDGGASLGGTDVGFALSLRPHFSGPPIHLGWHIVSSIAAVKRSGAVARALKAKFLNIGVLGRDHQRSPSVTFYVPRLPAFYRVKINFYDRAGRLLGHYAEYFRILKRRTDVDLSLARQQLRVGDDLVSELENPGTTSLFFGLGWSVDRFEAGEWKRDPVTPSGFPEVGFVMVGGEAEECRSLEIPSNMAPGHYRFRKKVAVVGGAARYLSTEFDVLP